MCWYHLDLTYTAVLCLTNKLYYTLYYTYYTFLLKALQMVSLLRWCYTFFSFWDAVQMTRQTLTLTLFFQILLSRENVS